MPIHLGFVYGGLGASAEWLRQKPSYLLSVPYRKSSLTLQLPVLRPKSLNPFPLPYSIKNMALLILPHAAPSALPCYSITPTSVPKSYFSNLKLTLLPCYRPSVPTSYCSHLQQNAPKSNLQLRATAPPQISLNQLPPPTETACMRYLRRLPS